MKWSFTVVGVFFLGLIGVAIIFLFQSLTTNSENDYYLLKEITEASMFDAIDYKEYRETGILRIKEKIFVESFTRRFAESTLFIGNSYTIKMFDIMEYPPKVTVMIDNGVGSYIIQDNTSNYSVINSLSSIFEYNNKEILDISEESIFYSDDKDNDNNFAGYKDKKYEKDYYSFVKVENSSIVNFQGVLKIPDILDVRGGLINVTSVDILDGPIIVEDNFMENVMIAILNKDIDWITGDETNYLDNRIYDISNYYFDAFNASNIEHITLCNKEYSDKCNGINTFLFNWRATINNTDKNLMLVKYKIRWNYKLFE